MNGSGREGSTSLLRQRHLYTLVMLIELLDLHVTIRSVRVVEFVRDRPWRCNGLCCIQLFLHPQQMSLVSDDPYELDVRHGSVTCLHAFGKIQEPGDRGCDATASCDEDDAIVGVL